MSIEQEVEDWVAKLPAFGPITIRVYNETYVDFIRQKIAAHFNTDRAASVTFIVPGMKDKPETGWDRNIYISPILHNYVGNGYN